MRQFGAALLAGVLLAVVATRASADDARPAALTIRESAAGTFDLRWQTPMRGQARLRASPRLPEGAVTLDGTYDRRVTGDALVETWRFKLTGGLEGRTIALDGLATSRRGAIVTVELASGAVHRAVLSGARVTFDVPEPVASARTRWFDAVPSQVADGAREGLGWVHLAFALAIALAGGWRGLAYALGAFLVGDVLGRVAPLTIPPELGTALVALAGALAARQAALGSGHRLVALALLGGCAHGLGLPAAPLHEVVASAFGLDAVHVAVGLLALGVVALTHITRVRRWACLTVGVAATALAIGPAFDAPARAAPAKRAKATIPMAMVGDKPLTPQRTTVEGLDLYLDISVFQTRVELLSRLPALLAWLEQDVGADPIPVDAQAALLERITRAAREQLDLTIDGVPVEPVLDRRGFTRRDAIGVYFRDDAIPEPIEDAVVGVVWKCETEGIPEHVTLHARSLPEDVPLRARVLDPEVSRDVPISLESPRIEWSNALESDPLPPIEAVEVHTEALVMPVVGLSLALLVLLWGVWTLRRRPGHALLGLRLGLTAALIAMPLGALSIPALGESLPELALPEARAITGTLLDNVYRAFNERGEEEAYDRLALSLVGDELEQAYLDNRSALALEEVGLSVHVDVVEVRSLENLVPREDGSFAADATWTVAGSVTHFGHRHLRQNLYAAHLVIRPVGGAWKIEDIDLRQLERIR